MINLKKEVLKALSLPDTIVYIWLSDEGEIRLFICGSLTEHTSTINLQPDIMLTSNPLYDEQLLDSIIAFYYYKRKVHQDETN